MLVTTALFRGLPHTARSAAGYGFYSVFVSGDYCLSTLTLPRAYTRSLIYARCIFFGGQVSSLQSPTRGWVGPSNYVLQTRVGRPSFRMTAYFPAVRTPPECMNEGIDAFDGKCGRQSPADEALEPEAAKLA